MGEELYRREAPHIPTEERALARLQLAVERGELQELPTLAGIRGIQGVLPRYLVTYMNSQTTNNAMRAATVVSVSNRAPSIQPGGRHVLQRLDGRLGAGGHGGVHDPYAVLGELRITALAGRINCNERCSESGTDLRRRPRDRVVGVAVHCRERARVLYGRRPRRDVARYYRLEGGRVRQRQPRRLTALGIVRST